MKNFKLVTSNKFEKLFKDESVGGIGIVYGRKESMKKPLKSNQVNLVG